MKELNTTAGQLTTARSTTNSAASGIFSFYLSPDVAANIVFFILLAITIIIANLLVLISIYMNRRLRCPTYLLILSLSVADLMVGLVLLPVRVMELLSLEWSRTFVLCKMTLSLNLFNLSASMLNLLAVTADRFLAISYSLTYSTMVTNNRMCVIITIAWLTAFVVSFFPLFGVGMKPAAMYRVHHLCRYGDVMEDTYMTLYFAVICAAPTVLITAAYFKIFFLARSQERRIASLKVYVNGGRGSAWLAVDKRIRFARESKAAKTTGKTKGISI